MKEAKTARINALNGVKALFIFLVVFYHTFNGDGPISHIFTPVKLYGGFIVNYLFFMLSGFLTAYSFSKNKISKRNFFDYFKGKLMRLYPLYVISNIWQLVASISLVGLSAFSLSQFISILTMQVGGTLTDTMPYNYPTWFLCSLMVCFVVQYAIRYFCKDNPRKYVWVYYAFFIIGIILENSNLNIPFLFTHNGEAFANFFLGCILFEHYRLLCNKKVLLYLSWVAVLFFLVYPPARAYLGDVRYAITFVFCPVVIIAALEESLLSKFFQTKVMQFLGRISMYIFFIHATYPLKEIPLHFSNYYVGYAVYLLLLIAISSAFAFLSSIISSKITDKKSKKMSYATVEEETNS